LSLTSNHCVAPDQDPDLDTDLNLDQDPDLDTDLNPDQDQDLNPDQDLDPDLDNFCFLLLIIVLLQTKTQT